jgi:hypothetical protein
LPRALQLQRHAGDPMATRITELFGYAPEDVSDAATTARSLRHCPFIKARCEKTLSDGEISGVCSLKPVRGSEVICCPNRLYSADYKILHDVAGIAFGPGAVLFRGQDARKSEVEVGKFRVAVFGKRWGGELRLPNRTKSGGYFVDWILSKLTDSGEIDSFVAVEVQSIDTTGNYRAAREDILMGRSTERPSTAGFNWENVNKRILPQLIYKGHVLRREKLCSKGLFFVCPSVVFEKIKARLGSNLLGYNLQSGSLSFMWYEVDDMVTNGQVRNLTHVGRFTTTVDQVALAFTAPSNLPEQNVYEQAIRTAL